MWILMACVVIIPNVAGELGECGAQLRDSLQKNKEFSSKYKDKGSVLDPYRYLF